MVVRPLAFKRFDQERNRFFTHRQNGSDLRIVRVGLLILNPSLATHVTDLHQVECSYVREARHCRGKREYC